MINKQLEVTCDRCGQPVLDATTISLGTGNYYSVAPGSYWAEFSRTGERDVCDKCMWADPKYQEMYDGTVI